MMKCRWFALAVWASALWATTAAQAAEPTVDEVRAAALTHAGLNGTLDGTRKRTRLRHLLPRVTARVSVLTQDDTDIEFEEFLSRDATGELLFDAARNENATSMRDRYVYSIQATMDLRGLIFDDDELAAARHSRALFDSRARLVEAVHLAYFRRLALVDELRGATENRRKLAHEVLALEARLDGLSGGWFSRKLREAP